MVHYLRTCNKRYLDHQIEVPAVLAEQIQRTRTVEQVDKHPFFISTAKLCLAICSMQLVCPY